MHISDAVMFMHIIGGVIFMHISDAVIFMHALDGVMFMPGCVYADLCFFVRQIFWGHEVESWTH